MKERLLSLNKSPGPIRKVPVAQEEHPTNVMNNVKTSNIFATASFIGSMFPSKGNYKVKSKTTTLFINEPDDTRLKSDRFTWQKNFMF